MRKRAHTTTEAELRRLADEGLNWEAVGKQTGIDPNAIRTAASVLGIKSAHHRRSEHPRVRLWASRIGRGETADEVAKSEGITRQAVYSALARHGLPRTTRDYIKAALAQKAEQPGGAS